MTMKVLQQTWTWTWKCKLINHKTKAPQQVVMACVGLFCYNNVCRVYER